MARTISKNYEIPQTVNITKMATIEEISCICEYKDSKIINVDIAYKTDEGETLDKVSVSIFGGNYELLMSESPDFATGKPLNEYREVDLWYMIDLIKQ